MTEFANINKLAIVVPCFNEEDNVCDLFDLLQENLSELSFVVYFVDDGSTDSTLEKIEKLREANPRVQYISLSKNFGKEAALYAGLEMAFKNEYSDFIVMDADMQDPPAVIPEMLAALSSDSNCQAVCTRRINRSGEGLFVSLFSKNFYAIINKVSTIRLKTGVRDFRLMTRKYVKAILACGEYNRFFKGITSWIGFKVAWVEFENNERANGKSKWGFFKLLKYGISGIVSFTSLPLTAFSVFGACMSILPFIALLFVVIRASIVGDPVAGWPSLVCIILFMGGLILAALGLLGLYFEKMFS